MEAYGDYVKIYTKEKMLVTKQRLSNIEKLLPGVHFFKTHRSYIVALSAVEFVEGNSVVVNGQRLPVSKTSREALLQKLG